MSRRLLFLCHHGAAKSVLGAAFSEEAAKNRHLDVEIDFAGTDPDERIAPHVVAYVAAHGIALKARKPRMLTQENLTKADVVVSMGCPLDGFDLGGIVIEHWDDVPAPSEDLEGAAKMVQKQVGELFERLLQSWAIEV